MTAKNYLRKSIRLSNPCQFRLYRKRSSGSAKEKSAFACTLFWTETNNPIWWSPVQLCIWSLAYWQKDQNQRVQEEVLFLPILF